MSSVPLTNHKAAADTNAPSPAHRDSPPLGATRGRHRRYGPAKASTWLWVQQKSQTLQGPSALQGCRHTHTPWADGGTHTVVPEGEVRRQGLFFLRATLLFSTSSPLLLATPSTCDTTDSLMLHYPYTSLSLSVPLPAMFPHVASKLGHEHVQEATEARPHGAQCHVQSTATHAHKTR